MICLHIHCIYYKVFDFTINLMFYLCNICALNRDKHKIYHPKLSHPCLNLLIFVNINKKNILCEIKCIIRLI